MNFLNYLHSLTLAQFLSSAIICAPLLAKFYLLSVLHRLKKKETTILPLWTIITTMVAITLFSEINSLLFITETLNLTHFADNTILFCTRISWATTIIFLATARRYLATALQTTISYRSFMTRTYGAFIAIACYFLLSFPYFIYKRAYPSSQFFDQYLFTTLFIILAVRTALALYTTLRRASKPDVPSLVRRKLLFSLYLFILPLYLGAITQCMQLWLITPSPLLLFFIGLQTLNALLLTLCTTNPLIATIAELATVPTIQHHSSCVQQLSKAVEELYSANTMSSLVIKTQEVFQQLFALEKNEIMLYIKEKNVEGTSYTKQEEIIEKFLKENGSEQLLLKKPILLYKELAYQTFYNPSLPHYSHGKTFLDTINAEIFIPLARYETISGYILITKNDRRQHLYSPAIQNELLMIAHHLTAKITTLHHAEMTTLFAEKESLRKELHEINHHLHTMQESLYSLIRNEQFENGIIIYHKNQFFFSDAVTERLCGAAFSSSANIAIKKALEDTISCVTNYRSSHTIETIDIDGNKQTITGYPLPDNETVILIVASSNKIVPLFNLIKRLHKPSYWDYLVYLETTTAGKIINEALPGTTQELVAFKAQLLKAALTKKALLIKAHDKDLQTVVDTIHLISGKEQLHILNLEKPFENDDVSIKLFGVNSALQIEENNLQENSIFETLDKQGTLFIKNIDFLPIQTQKELASFIESGSYHPFKSKQKKISDIRIICSISEQGLSSPTSHQLDKKLYEQITSLNLEMPSFTTLNNTELVSLSQELIHHTKKKIYPILLDKEEQKQILQTKPINFTELKSCVQRIIEHRAKQKQRSSQTVLNPESYASDQELFEALQLGKKALKSKKIMTILWDRFRNQNKIANLLGVNYSSVNRRCKDYDLN